MKRHRSIARRQLGSATAAAAAPAPCCEGLRVGGQVLASVLGMHTLSMLTAEDLCRLAATGKHGRAIATTYLAVARDIVLVDPRGDDDPLRYASPMRFVAHACRALRIMRFTPPWEAEASGTMAQTDRNLVAVRRLTADIVSANAKNLTALHCPLQSTAVVAALLQCESLRELVVDTEHLGSKTRMQCSSVLESLRIIGPVFRRVKHTRLLIDRDLPNLTALDLAPPPAGREAALLRHTALRSLALRFSDEKKGSPSAPIDLTALDALLRSPALARLTDLTIVAPMSGSKVRDRLLTALPSHVTTLVFFVLPCSPPSVRVVLPPCGAALRRISANVPWRFVPTLLAECPHLTHCRLTPAPEVDDDEDDDGEALDDMDDAVQMAFERGHGATLESWELPDTGMPIAVLDAMCRHAHALHTLRLNVLEGSCDDLVSLLAQHVSSSIVDIRVDGCNNTLGDALLPVLSHPAATAAAAPWSPPALFHFPRLVTFHVSESVLSPEMSARFRAPALTSLIVESQLPLALMSRFPSLVHADCTIAQPCDLRLDIPADVAALLEAEEGAAPAPPWPSATTASMCSSVAFGALRRLSLAGRLDQMIDHLQEIGRCAGSGCGLQVVTLKCHLLAPWAPSYGSPNPERPLAVTRQQQRHTGTVICLQPNVRASAALWIDAVTSSCLRMPKLARLHVVDSVGIGSESDIRAALHPRLGCLTIFFGD